MLPPRTSCLLSALLLVTALAALPGCPKEGCLDPTVEDCTVPSPCTGLDEFVCSSGTVSIKVVESPSEVPGGLDALGAPGDVLLANDQVVAVVEAIDHPHYLGPTGGSLLDLGTLGDDNDSLRHIFQVTGALPNEAFNYTEMKLIEEEGLVAVQFRGTLDGRPNVPVATRYELRNCEPGIRVRSELVNLEPDPASITVSDGFYSGGREHLPFSPRPGAGFEHPSFGLSTLGDAIFGVPWVAYAAHSDPGAAYATIACNAPSSWGFQSDNVATNGTKTRPIPYGEWIVHERFIAVGEGESVADAANIAMEVRRQLFDEEYVVVEGTVAIEGDGDVPIGDGLRASVHVTSGTAATPVEERTPWNHALVEADGTFQLAVPSNDTYTLEVESYGVRGAAQEVTVASDNLDAGVLTVPQVGQVTISGTVDTVEDWLQVFVVPADDATDEQVRAAMFGQFVDCAPLLGAPYGGAPACNRVFLGPEGPQTLGILPGNYDLLAIAGPFSTMATVQNVAIGAGETVGVDLQVETLALINGGLSSDFHVHGGTSFDSNVPHEPRVAAWLAAGLDVVATTEHDAAWDFAEARERLGADDRLQVMVGTESTGHILWKFLPENEFPSVFGHWNIWPLPFDPAGPWRGAPWDELVEPGQLFDRAVEQGWDRDDGVIQLNHPIEDALFARDQGYATSVGVDGTMPLPTEFDGTPASTFMYTPPGSAFANSDYNVQEVMNGTNNFHFPSYRAFWHYLMNQGIFRAGTANADSHTLTDNVVGTPRTIVYSDQTVADFDAATFNAALKDGRAFGTNGPVIETQVSWDGADPVGPSMTAFTPGAGAVLNVKVEAAPWVPIAEVRILVNGAEARVITTELSHPADAFDTDGIRRLDLDIVLDGLLPSDGSDAWLVIEAGAPLAEHADLDCDGFPDTADHNGDGTIDWRDVEGLEEEPKETACLEDTGPQASTPTPERTDPAWPFWVVTPGGYPLSFTNPFILDRDASGAFDAPGVAR